MPTPLVEDHAAIALRLAAIRAAEGRGAQAAAQAAPAAPSSGTTYSVEELRAIYAAMPLHPRG